MSSQTPQPGTIDESSAERTPSRYVIGIDLGTTNCALCYVDSSESSFRIQTFSIPQIVSPGQTERLETLPSFHYQGTPLEVESAAFRLPWMTTSPSDVVGVFARDQGRSVSGRMIESAKSWLCHSGVDRRAALLPWHGASDVRRLSPVEASAGYLRHLREAWNADHPEHLLEHQDVMLTIPASFDEVARELTVLAARAAGLPRIVLLEEPQAAFYSWVFFHRNQWQHCVSPGQKILVCDIGGGTSDFSLIHVRSGENGTVQFHRVAVGEHLLLGGDNLDLAIAHFVEQQLADRVQLDPRQWSMLIPACRHAKETLLSASAPESHTIVISGTGSRLIGGSIQLTLNRSDIIRLLLEGFLPDVPITARPEKRQSGFQEFGLPYAPDAAITRYLATFLRTQMPAGGDLQSPDTLHAIRPDVVLFNGGFFESGLLRDQLIDALQKWFRVTEPDWAPLILKNERLDLAVAQGAAWFGMVRRGHGERIVAGLARTYYVGVRQPDGSTGALCLVAAGTESTQDTVTIDRLFHIRTSEPVEFPIYVSATRLSDQPGELVNRDPEQLTSLPPIRTVLTGRRNADSADVEVKLQSRLTEIGTLELWCEQTSGGRKWQLQFDVRAATETDRDGHTGTAEQAGIVDQDLIQSAADVIESLFGPNASLRPDDVMSRLTEAVGMNRQDWPPSLLRSIWSALVTHHEGRRRSAQHEARWLNLTGFCLRPGFGMAADDWRVEETWRVISGRLVHSVPACLAELRTLCRRLAGGLSAGRQNQIASSVLPAIRQRYRQVQTGRGKAPPYASGNHEAAEIWRMLGALELLDVSTRSELGSMACDLMVRASFEPVRPALIWMLGRVGARVPAYGPLNLVVPVSLASEWADCLLRFADPADATVQLTLMQLCRRTGDRYRDHDESLRKRVLDKLRAAGARPHFVELIETPGTLAAEETSLIFGDALPAGLRLA